MCCLSWSSTATEIFKRIELAIILLPPLRAKARLLAPALAKDGYLTLESKKIHAVSSDSTSVSPACILGPIDATADCTIIPLQSPAMRSAFAQASIAVRAAISCLCRSSDHHTLPNLGWLWIPRSTRYLSLTLQASTSEIAYTHIESLRVPTRSWKRAGVAKKRDEE